MTESIDVILYTSFKYSAANSSNIKTCNSQTFRLDLQYYSDNQTKLTRELFKLIESFCGDIAP